MAKFVLYKLDTIINHLTLLLILGGGMVIHTLTSLTISSYYGSFWGYVSFFLPGGAEAYLIAIQLGDNMYNYSMLLAIFTATALALLLILLFKNLIRAKIVAALEKRATDP